jgi:Mn2+/Fe2+ NRAMP family transporter
MQEKPWYLSRTIIGAIVMLAITFLGQAGVDVKDADLNQITTTILQVTEALVALGSFALIIWGRIRARKEITLARAQSAPKDSDTLGEVVEVKAAAFEKGLLK